MNTNDERARDAGYDDFLDALEANKGYYLRCPNDHGWLPPRSVCPACGARQFERHPLPEQGTVVSRTTIHVAAPQFAESTPYSVALVDMGQLTLTGQVRGVDPDAVEPGLEVSPRIVENETTQGRLLGFEPA